MDVTWLGHGCFRLRGKNAAVVNDPFPPALGPKLPRLEADLVTISHEHENHAYTKAVKDGAYLIQGPGEYEVAGVVVNGLLTYHDAANGAEYGRNTVYVIELDDVRVCHLGDLGHGLDDAALGAIGNVDLLLAPVGGGRALDAAKAAEVVRQVEPRVVVPMHYGLPAVKKDLEPVERFLREMGVNGAEPQPKLSIQASSAESETRVVVLEARAS
ncbi:MAG: MBL fold metallo-hydrolase [Candidatus Dormibacteraeota bacterium]|nr:MBL fold metallo-hydrolase [Candidatus Dormibacteraeota bacterium]